MSHKSKSKNRSQVQEADNEPYYHPTLEEQMIIRFPADIAAKLNSMMDFEADRFKDFKIKFTDKNHATIKLFGEELHAVLVSLPTIVETHRTVDGSHLFKSADIGEILIVHRPNFAVEGVSQDFVYDHGLTPPTQSIVDKRKAKQDSARGVQSDGTSLDGIQYWEMVEIQLAALLSKEKTAKPICRQEFFEEPDIDPVTLEKILRRNKGPDFKGYSGREIDESEIDVLSENEPVVHIPQEILDEISNEQHGNKESLDNLNDTDEHEKMAKNQFSQSNIEPSSTETETDSLNYSANQSSHEESYSSSSSDEEEEEEEDIPDPELKKLKSDLKRELLKERQKIQALENIKRQLSLSLRKGDEDRYQKFKGKQMDFERDLNTIKNAIEEIKKAIGEKKSSQTS